MELFERFATEMVVGGALVFFGFLVRYWTHSFSQTMNSAVNRIEEVAQRVHRMEVENAARISELSVHVKTIAARLDRELANNLRENG